MHAKMNLAKVQVIVMRRQVFFGEERRCHEARSTESSAIPLFCDGVLVRFRIFHDQPARGRLRERAAAAADAFAVIATGPGPSRSHRAGIPPLPDGASQCRTILSLPRATPSHSLAR